MSKTNSLNKGFNLLNDTANDDFAVQNKEMRAEQLCLFKTTTPEEERILNKIYEFEEIYFGDLTLKDYKKELVGSRKKINGKWEITYEDLAVHQKVSFINNDWRVTFFGDPNYDGGRLGYCDEEKRLIGIARSQIDDDSNLLHEMIHGYEFMLKPYLEYHQYIMIKLYEKISLQIPNLDKIIKWDIHTDNLVYHSPLLLLKSLELDIKLQQPFGTVYCYGRERYFRQFAPYTVKYKLLNTNPTGKYKSLTRYWRFYTKAEARDFIVEYQKERMEKAKPKMVGFFPELFRPKPIEYGIFKIDSNGRYSKLIELFRDEDVLDLL